MQNECSKQADSDSDAVYPPPIYEKYGKEFDFSQINRDINFIKNVSGSAEQECRYVLENCELEYVAFCPVCKSKNYEELEQIYGFQYHKCMDCGHVFIFNCIKEPTLLYANGSAIQAAMYIDEELFAKRVQMIAHPKVCFINDFVKQYKMNEKDNFWVDLGCGTGEILQAASNEGWNITGFDADPHEVNFAKSKKLNAKVACIDMLHLDDSVKKAIGSAKIVSMFNLIEHIREPDKWIQELSQIMSSGTFLIIDTPREPSLARLANFTALSYNYKHLIPPEHVNVFTEKSLGMLLTDRGFAWRAKWCFGAGFLDLVFSAILLSDNDRFKGDAVDLSCFDDIFRASSNIQKTIDKSGLSNNMLCIFEKE